MSDRMLTIAAVVGLGEPADDPKLNGLRPYLVDLTSRYVERVGFLVYSHADPDLQIKIRNLPGDLLAIGHSHGGEEVHRTDILFNRAGRKLAGLLLMDAKPEWDSMEGVFDWLSPGYQYPIPVSTTNYHAFWGGFGRPFFRQVNSTRLNIGHADFPGAPECHKWIDDFVAAWSGASETL